MTVPEAPTEPLDPTAMLREVAVLGDDLCTCIAPVDEQVRDALADTDWNAVSEVYLTGDGDSYHASVAAEMAFATLGSVPCRALSALEWLEYGAPRTGDRAGARPLVVATSVSGATPRVLDSIRRARERGALTLALTGTPGSPLTEHADRPVVVELAGRERSPGIRTYQASVLAMLLTAVRLLETRGADPDGARSLRDELHAVATDIDATARALAHRCAGAAEAIADSPATVVAGSGPNRGTALHAVAKLVEAAGVIAHAQDLEEWWHVERFAETTGMPLVVVGPPSRSRWRAVELARSGRELGRTVIAVAHEGDEELARHAHELLPVAGEPREEFSPLLYHVFAAFLGCRVAQRLARAPFRTERRRDGGDGTTSWTR